ncbi:hypothetical protein EZV62_028146 [Acer yangbiense]|uniref:Uncharacterized protein n=1 Tax=Acer yangbiense TaxID=1000413 RepID=A0A5C7GNI2_9ROSI|nr:hypothetical protein EZV62_028146 [Acer yangbiense]
MVSEQHSVTSAPPMQAHNLSQGSATSSKLPTPLKLELTVKLDHNNFLLWRQQVLAAIKGIKQKNEHLETLEIRGCHSLTFIFRGQLPPSLKKLSIEDCEKLQCLLDDNETSTYSSSSMMHSSHLTTSLLEGIRQKNEHLETLEIRGCHSLTFIFRGQLPPSLKKLSIGSCVKLRCLLDDNETSTYSSSSVNVNHSHLVELTIYECPSLTCLPLPDQFSATLTSLVICYCSNLTTLWLPVALKCLYIEECQKLTTLLPRDQLPETLETLHIRECGKLESIVERFHNNTALNQIQISRCSNLKSIPDDLYTLSGLHEIEILNCQDLVSFPKGGFPNSILHVSITNCEKLKALPSQIHTLSSLRSLIISKCPSLSYPEEGFPANLLYLKISSPNLYKPLTNLGFHNLTSLIALNIHELADAESFHEEEMEMTLPHTLTLLSIKNFPKLKCLSCKSMENLTSLEYLLFSNCPELTSLPNLPSSLLGLEIRGCPLLKEACKRDKGKEWYKIADIPCVDIDYQFIYDAYEDSEM